MVNFEMESEKNETTSKNVRVGRNLCTFPSNYMDVIFPLRVSFKCCLPSVSLTGFSSDNSILNFV